MKCPFKKDSIVTGKVSGLAYTIIDDEGTATRTINVSNADEWELFSEPGDDDTPLVEGGQARTGNQLANDAVTVAVAIVGALLLLAWAVWSVM